jgi:endoglucanase
MNDDILLQTSGMQIATRSGQPITLRGVGLGGWMNMENFITGYPAKDEMRYRLLVDQLEIYRKHGAGWSIWTYKDIGLQGLVYADPASPYLQRIRPVLEKKARLGVDAWGSTDAGIRNIMGPIEETFRREFPDFQPFPWGQDSWVKTLVRHILLAEPLVDDFGRCFQGLGGDQAAALADSFRLESCIRRQRLLDILRADTARFGAVTVSQT